MKKSYIFSLALFATSSLFAQDSNDSLTFESFNLGSNLFYNGSDQLGPITINDIQLSNSYTPAYQSWMGFSVSSVQDNTTPGYMNQYASIANGGADNSSKYAVYYSEGEISFNQPRVLRSVQITNTTYAALTMRDGDDYTKAFGSALGLDGQPDGTEGKDWLKLAIIPVDAEDNVVGEPISFYLADYRFDDDSEDYIVTTWERINLNDVVATKLKFQMTSSDNGAWGMNTPAYFALDNLVTAATVGLTEKDNNLLSLSPNPTQGKINLSLASPAKIQLISASGTIVLESLAESTSIIDLTTLPSGYYILNGISATGTFSEKIIKL